MITVSIACIAVLAQDTPTAIAKSDLPREAECAVCSMNGTGHGPERPVAGLTFKGKPYYFCNASELPTFKANPDMYVPLVLPMPLPAFDLADSSGKVWGLEAFKGKVVLLDYWATWCKPCLELKPRLDRIRAAQKDKGFEVLSVSIDEKAQTLHKFLAKSKWENPVLHDTKSTWAGLKVVAIPALFLVRNGEVVAEFRGKVKMDELERAVKSALED